MSEPAAKRGVGVLCSTLTMSEPAAKRGVGVLCSTPNMGRPRFARAYPHDEALDALVDAFERGDYRRVRDEAPKLAAATEDDAVRAAAKDLRARIEPDPWAVRLVWLSLALFVVLTAYWTVVSHEPH